MPSRELYKTDLERHLYAGEPDRPQPKGERSGGKRVLRRAASVLGVVSGLGVAYWLYRRVRGRKSASGDRSPEFPEDDGSELAA